MAVDINSILTLERHHRGLNGKRYLESKLSQYNKLIGDSEVLAKVINDKLITQIKNPSSEKLSEIILSTPTNKNLDV